MHLYNTEIENLATSAVFLQKIRLKYRLKPIAERFLNYLETIKTKYSTQESRNKEIAQMSQETQKDSLFSGKRSIGKVCKKRKILKTKKSKKAG